MSATVTLKWYGDRIIGQSQEEMLRRMHRAGDRIVTQIQVNIGVPAPPHSVRGEFPHRLSGALQESVRYVIDRRRMTLTIVADAPHAGIVEEMRPYLRRTIQEMRKEIRSILEAGG